LKAFVTGATGLVGSSLCERLVRDGHHVRAFVRPTSDASYLQSLGSVEFVEGDITDDIAKLGEAIGDADTVFHTAALVDDWADRDDMVKVNVTSFENLLEAGREKNLARLVYLSSQVVLGMDEQNYLDETAQWVHTGDNYNYTKILAEQVAESYLAQGVPIVIFRPPYIYGPRDRQFFPRLVGNIRSGAFRFIGDGSNPFELVYVGNLVEAMMRAIEVDAAVGETFIISDGEPITRRELVELICERLGLDVPDRHVPVWFARMLMPLLEGTHRLLKLSGSPLLNRFKFKFMYTPLTFNIEKVRRVLGYVPVKKSREALALSVDWYRDNVLNNRGPA